jgi:hypothetical protein
MKLWTLLLVFKIARDIMQLSENKDYQFIPVNRDGKESWDIRILEGEFVETVFYFDKIQVADDGEHIKFNFYIVSTPNPDLNEDNQGLQKYAGMVLYNILESAIQVDSEQE